MPRELRPLEGIGAVRFGATPNEVRKEFGFNLVWEEWMGGNLNDSLYYPGVVFGFDDHDSHGPLESASLGSVRVNSKFPALLFELPLESLDRERVLAVLAARSIGTKAYPNLSIEAPSLGLHFGFCSDGSFEELVVASRPNTSLERGREG